MLVNLVNYAVHYAERGFSVIPIGQNKRPLIKFADKPPLTTAEIKKLWDRFPLANIALKTDKFFVIDCDNHEGQPAGIDELKKLNHNDWFKNTLTETTKHGGFHFYFQKPKNVTMTQVIGILPSVDLKANNNNYVVVAPSKGYKFINKEPMKIAPKGLMDWIKSKTEKPDKTRIANLYQKINRRTKTTDLFETIINGFGDEGSRNDRLTEFMGGLLLRNVNPNIAAQLAILANDNTSDPLPINEVERTVRSIVKSEGRRRSHD